jgi:hypothetical protein
VAGFSGGGVRPWGIFLAFFLDCTAGLLVHAPILASASSWPESIVPNSSALRSVLALALCAASAEAFATPASSFATSRALQAANKRVTLRGGATNTAMVDITPNVSFDTIAREWRCKWSGDNDKASLVKAQDAITEVLAEVQSISS